MMYRDPVVAPRPAIPLVLFMLGTFAAALDVGPCPASSFALSQPPPLASSHPRGTAPNAGPPEGAAPAGEPATGCPSEIAAWKVSSGELRPGLRCGTYLGTTNGAAAAFSYGQFTRREPVELPYEAELSWRRLGSDSGRSLELLVPGGIVLLRDGFYGLFLTNGAFAAEGWRPLPGYSTARETKVSIRQDAEHLTLAVEGKVVHIWALEAPALRGDFGVAFKGAPGHRSRLLFRDVRLRSLGGGGAVASGVGLPIEAR